MVPYAVPTGHRCAGQPPSGQWGDLGTVTEQECQFNCLSKPACKFALYKKGNKRCTSFAECGETEAKPGFKVWQKVGATRDARVSPSAERQRRSPASRCGRKLGQQEMHEFRRVRRDRGEARLQGVAESWGNKRCTSFAECGETEAKPGFKV